MKRWLIQLGCASLAFSALTFQHVRAQIVTDGVNKKFSDVEAKLDSSKTKSETADVGILVAPGLVWAPNAFIESGYDDNPDSLYDENGSAFIRSGVGFTFTGVSQRTLAQFSASGSWLGLADDIQPNNRLSGSVGASVVHQILPGLTASVAGLYEHDASQRVEADTAGIATEIAYRSDIIGAFVRGRFADVQYANGYPVAPETLPDIAPLFLASAFDAQKAEASAGLIFRPTHWASPYIEGGSAKIDYTDQRLPDIVNRDGVNTYMKGGLRFTVSPELRTDLGWRWNGRDTDDKVITSYSSGNFDSALTWTPTRYFALTASVERTIGEPTSGFGVLADLMSYGMKASYVLMPGVTVALAGEHIKARELSNDFRYHANVMDAAVVYDYSSHVQLYTSARYEHFDVDWRDESYARFKALAGLRFIPDGSDLTKRTSDLAASFKDIHFPKGSNLTIWTGYSLFDLPGVRMTTVVGGPFFDQSLYQLTDQDGKADGGRIDIQLAKMAQYRTADGQIFSFGLSGFYAGYAGSSHATCQYTADTDCDFVNIVDFDPNEENNTGPFGILNTNAKRDVDYYGISLDARLGSLLGAGLEDNIPEIAYSPIRIGVAARGLNDRTTLTSSDPGVCLPVKAEDKLNT